mmetsp:Transcript_6144/g.11666  ORF Transcript_6144/g.11666 Transcript_6144/m.11666 type:complete len:188 (-) Transcript_6144:112-675(-)
MYSWHRPDHLLFKYRGFDGPVLTRVEILRFGSSTNSGRDDNPKLGGTTTATLPPAGNTYKGKGWLLPKDAGRQIHSVWDPTVPRGLSRTRNTAEEASEDTKTTDPPIDRSDAPLHQEGVKGAYGRVTSIYFSSAAAGGGAVSLWSWPHYFAVQIRGGKINDQWRFSSRVLISTESPVSRTVKPACTP